ASTACGATPSPSSLRGKGEALPPPATPVTGGSSGGSDGSAASGASGGGGASGGSSSGGSTTPPGSAQTRLFYKTFGDPSARAVVIVHGGPGSNGVMYEMTLAPALAAKGNYVITYDQRGSGRSPKGTASDFTFAKSTHDLDDLIHALDLETP